jgi:hypothetical protein
MLADPAFRNDVDSANKITEPADLLAAIPIVDDLFDDLAAVRDIGLDRIAGQHTDRRRARENDPRPQQPLTEFRRR